MSKSKKKSKLWLALLFLVGAGLGWASHHSFKAPGEYPECLEWTPCPDENEIRERLLDSFRCPPCPDCPEPETIYRTKYLDADCPECPECHIDCSDNPCSRELPDCPECLPEIIEIQIPILYEPDIHMEISEGYVIAYYDFDGELVEAASLKLEQKTPPKEQVFVTQIVESESPLSARLGYGEDDAVDFGMSFRISRKWGFYINGKWIHDADEFRYISLRAVDDYDYLRKPLTYKEDRMRVSGGVEVHF